MAPFPKLTPDMLTQEQRALWDHVAGGPRKSMIERADDPLPGPYNAWLQIPSFGQIGARMGERLRFESVLDGRLRELAILATGAHWKAEFEFWAHARVARAEGLPEAIIEAVRTGAPPPYETPEQRMVHEAACAILRTGRLPDDLAEAITAALGRPALVELVALVGFYCLVSFTLNAFDVTLPEGTAPVWTD
jgi:4-carboxymuconolactone decarboxylase